MKVFKNVLIVLTLFALLTGCYQEDNWLEDNWEKPGEYYPVVSNVTIISDQETYSEGDDIQFDLRFYSKGNVESITALEEYGGNAQEAFAEFAYSDAAYSEVSQTDSLLIDYTVPNGSSGTTISFEFVVTNENGLTDSNVSATNTLIHDISIDVQ
jgi:hypothetical protein